jgi:hypothetical protein
MHSVLINLSYGNGASILKLACLVDFSNEENIFETIVGNTFLAVFFRGSVSVSKNII